MVMVNIKDIMSIPLLEQHIAEGNVFFRQKGDLSVYKYSKTLPYKNIWDEVTTQTRGLIVHDSGEIVGRGFNKFFNLSQHSEGEVDLDADGIIMDKMDGSLGIAFHYDGQWIVSTQGSFDSEQAVHATELFRAQYNDTPVVDGMALMVEIIYPGNRIVCNYGDMDDLVLLGGMTNDGQWVHPDDIDFAGPKVPIRNGNIRDALNEPDPENGFEGFVIRQNNGFMVKIKFPHYMHLHRSMFTLNHNVVFDSIVNGNVAEFAASLPDEAYVEFNSYRNTIESMFTEVNDKIDFYGSMIPEGDRKNKAQWVGSNVPSQYRNLVISKFIAHNDIDVSVARIVKKMMVKHYK